jgi:hypothetical protein
MALSSSAAMTNITDSTSVHVFTYKQGILAAVAHDLKLEATGYEVTRGDDGAVHARFDPAGLKVVCAMKKGKENPGGLRDKDKDDIVKNINADVLQTAQYGEITFSSSSISGDKVSGTLSLHGVDKEVEVKFKSEGGAKVARVDIDQRAFGITPFKALGGTLKVKPTVTVEIRTTGL